MAKKKAPPFPPKGKKKKAGKKGAFGGKKAPPFAKGRGKKKNPKGKPF